MKKISFGRMFIISLLGFALTFSSNIQDPPLMTFKVRQLAPDLPNTVLGLLGFIGLLVAMAVQPIVGIFSDRASTRWGRRLPFLVGGVVLIAASLFLLAAAPTLWVLLMGVILIQFSSNVLQGPWQALIPDLVPERQRGTASSLKAVMDIVALVVGGLVAGKILSAGIDRWGDNGVYLAAAAPTVVFVLFVIFTAIWAREKPYTVSETKADHPVFQPGGGWLFVYWLAVLGIICFLGYQADALVASSTRDWIYGLYLKSWVMGDRGGAFLFQMLGALIRILSIFVVGFIVVMFARIPGKPRRFLAAFMKDTFGVNFKDNPVFGWWFANRILFWGAFIAINSFLINYMVDVVGMSEKGAQNFYGNLKMILGGALIVLALVAGWLSDRVGRKPVMLVSGLVSFAGAFMLLFVRDQTLISVAGGIVGMGIGAFIAVSWALATDIVPKGEAARYLGIANIATCIGSGVARLLGGVLIDPINKALGSASTGYISLYALAALCFLASALVIIPLPNKKKA
jgi:MFS family permease